MRGPLVLFAVGDSQPGFDKAELLRAQLANNVAGDSTVTSAEGKSIAMRPYMSIKDESYSTYVRLNG